MTQSAIHTTAKSPNDDDGSMIMTLSAKSQAVPTLDNAPRDAQHTSNYSII